MRQIYAIAKAELSILFFSPIAWLIIVIFSFQACSSFANVFDNLINKQELAGMVPNVTVELFSDWNSIYLAIQNNLYLYIPLLTMGLMSREYSSGSIKLLYSSPLGGIKVIFGKYLSILIFAVVMMGTVIPLITFTMFKVESADFTFMLSGLLGLTLLMFAYSAIGLYMSILTSYQVVAAMCTLGVLALLNNFGSIGQEVDFLRDVTYWLSLRGRADKFITGLITSEDIMYFIVVIFIFLSLSVIKLNSDKSKESLVKLSLKYASVMMIAMIFAYLSSNPKMVLYYDASQVKANTLTQNSQDIIDSLDSKLKVITYVNMADNNFHYAIPRTLNTDKKRFYHYTRFIPSIRMEYVYYFDEPIQNRNYQAGVTSAEDLARQYTKPCKIDFEKVLKPNEIREQIDLFSEGNTFVRVLQTPNGKSTFLRIFNDMQKHPGESEISGALKRLIGDVPRVVFTTGSGEPSISKAGEADFTNFSVTRSNRAALINQGYDVCALDLGNHTYDIIKDTADILVLADPKEMIAGDDLVKILKFLEDGGNMLITTEPGRECFINEIIENLGLKFIPGVLVTPNQDFSPTLISSRITRFSLELSHYFRMLAGRVVTMPTAVGLDFELGNEFEVIPITTTLSRGTWNEVETSNFIYDPIVFNRSAGEVQRIIPTSFALTRMIDGKEQRIVVVGDSDCLSNTELTGSRAGIEAGNIHYIKAIFNWLSNGVLPVDVRRESPPDNKIYLSMGQMKKWKVALVWAIPSILALIGTAIFIRRKRR